MDEARRSSRRNFLKGRSAADAIVDIVDHLGRPSGEDSLPAGEFTAQGAPNRYQVQVGRRAMACQFSVFMNAGQYRHGTETAIAALDLVDTLESQLTVYRDDSEVAELNLNANDGPVPVEPRLFQLLQQGQAYHHATGGAYDLTSGVLSKVWGFYRRDGKIPGEAELQAALQCVGSQHLLLDDETQTAYFLRPGLEINLGSIGKGYALDRAAELLEAQGVEHFLFHGGQSSVLARGDQGGVSGWIVGLRHPLRADRRLAEIRLRNRALGTSGSGTQFFFHEGRRYGHILDPRTGWPAQQMLSSTVIAPTGAEADALATAFYVLGVEGAREYCRQHPEIGAILICQAAGAKLEIESLNLTSDDWQLLDQESENNASE